jgi:hypothetical protein
VKYLILIYHNQQVREGWARLSDAERAQGLQALACFMKDLVESGEMVASEALADPSRAKRVSVSQGRTTTTDGPFAEVKEYLAGFYLVECQSIDRAVEHAARIAEAAFAVVEVRPVLAPNGSDM